LVSQNVPVVGEPWWARQRYASVAMWFCSVVSVLIGIGQMSIHGAVFGLDEYDDGVYFGSAVRLAQGHLPYRSFVFPHPPGITLLLFPLGLLGRLTSTRVTFGLVRILTTLVAAGSVWMIGRLLRHRGVIAVLAGGLALAVYPLASAATKSVLLEPYVVFVVLVAATLLFRDGELQDGRRLMWGGAVLGMALALKLWALLPIAAMVVCFAIVVRRDLARWRRLATGLFAGFAVPCAPFFFAAPRQFVHQVVGLQLQRGASSGGLPAKDRIVLVVGSRVLPELQGAQGWSLLLLVLVAAAIAVSLLVKPKPQAFDWFAVAAALVSVAAVLKTSDYFTHYGYFVIAFLALAGGAATGRLSPVCLGLAGRRVVVKHLLAAAAVVAVLGCGLNGVLRSRAILHRWPDLVTTGDVGRVLARLIPDGACAVSDDPSLLITADRVVGGDSCPAMIDPYYAWLAEDPQHPPSSGAVPPAALVQQWQSWFERAEFVVLSSNPFRVPRTPELSAWFNEHFDLVGSVGPAVWRRK